MYNGFGFGGIFFRLRVIIEKIIIIVYDVGDNFILKDLWIFLFKFLLIIG